MCDSGHSTPDSYTQESSARKCQLWLADVSSPDTDGLPEDGENGSPHDSAESDASWVDLDIDFQSVRVVGGRYMVQGDGQQQGVFGAHTLRLLFPVELGEESDGYLAEVEIQGLIDIYPYENHEPAPHRLLVASKKASEKRAWIRRRRTNPHLSQASNLLLSFHPLFATQSSQLGTYIQTDPATVNREHSVGQAARGIFPGNTSPYNDYIKQLETEHQPLDIDDWKNRFGYQNRRGRVGDARERRVESGGGRL